MVTPAPAWMTAPVPLMAEAKSAPWSRVLERLKVRVALLTRALRGLSDPVVLPSPSARLPALMAMEPPYVLVAVRTRLPVPVLVKVCPALPEMIPGTVRMLLAVTSMMAPRPMMPMARLAPRSTLAPVPCKVALLATTMVFVALEFPSPSVALMLRTPSSMVVFPE